MSLHSHVDPSTLAWPIYQTWQEFGDSLLDTFLTSYGVTEMIDRTFPIQTESPAKISFIFLIIRITSYLHINTIS